MTHRYIGWLSLLSTIFIYYINKKLYAKFKVIPLMPLIFTPTLLILMLMLVHVTYEDYMITTQWLLWMLGPATIAFAIPMNDNISIIKKHWLSLLTGVLTATLVSVTSAVCLARILSLPESIQRSLALHSVTAPFALSAAKTLDAPLELVALFGVITGLFGMAIGDIFFVYFSIHSKNAKGASFGAAANGAGTAHAYTLGQEEGVVASLVMMLSGITMVLLAPFINIVMF